jgi:hypothetical protein
MGLRSSLYALVQGALQAKHLVLRDPTDDENPFQWDHIEENLPCAPDYDPSLTWIMKRRKDGRSILMQ